MQVEPEEMGLWPPKFGKIKKFRGTSVLPPSLWENNPVLCQQHHVLSPLSWASSLQTITLQHPELTVNSHYCFPWQFHPSAWPMLHFKICTACFAVHDLGCFTTSPYLSPEFSIQTKTRIRAVPMGNLCITDEQPEIFLLWPCSHGAGPTLVHLSLTQWQHWRPHRDV